MAKTVVGLFDDASANRVVSALEDAGFSRGDIETRSNRATASAAALTRIGISEGDAQAYSDAVGDGGNTLVTLGTSDERADEASRIMQGFSPRDLGAGHGAKRAARPGEPSREGAVIPVVEEELEIGKRTIETGGVRVFSHTVEQPVEEDITLREEHVSVERRPVDRPATEDDIRAAASDRTIELTERAEKAVIGKSAHVVEEVVVGKDVEQRTERATDTVRRTEVEVESLRGGGAWDADSLELRRHFDANYAGDPNARWEIYEPAYRHGYDLSNDRRFAARDWSAAENEARTSWEANSPGTWERMKGAVRHAFERARAKRGAERHA